MSRFHSKFHNKSHHTDATVGFLDSATDPIASETLPFQGDMWVNGVLRADTIVLSETIANLEVDTLVVNNTVTAFTTGSLTATTLVGDGSGVTNVNAATLGGFAGGAFVKIAEKGVANGVAPLDGDTHVPFENLPDSLSSFETYPPNGSNITDVDAVTLNGLSDTAFLKPADKGVANGVAPLDGGSKVAVTYLPDIDAVTLNGLSDTNLKKEWVTAPVLSSDGGVIGDIAYDGSFLYVHVAANTWVRTNIVGW
jgi:hypothetical protein